jgi:hypothetical protein
MSYVLHTAGMVFIRPLSRGGDRPHSGPPLARNWASKSWPTRPLLARGTVSGALTSTPTDWGGASIPYMTVTADNIVANRKLVAKIDKRLPLPMASRQSKSASRGCKKGRHSYPRHHQGRPCCCKSRRHGRGATLEDMAALEVATLGVQGLRNVESYTKNTFQGAAERKWRPG